MHIIASTNILTVLGGLSSTLPLVYMTDGTTVTTVGYPTLNLSVELTYLTSTQYVTETSLLALRPAAAKVIGIDI